ncbi:3-hydroxybutyrate oligomer hydrolase family protein [Cupriavidus basilensis]
MASDGTRQRSFGPDKIVVIASSVSNGGGAAVAAAEQDTQGLIDGVAVAEPNLNLPRQHRGDRHARWGAGQQVGARAV